MVSWQARHQIVPAVYVILERAGQVLVIRRANTGYRDGFYSLPSGHLEEAESPTAGAIRETAEEVGVELTPEQLECVHVQYRRAEEGDHDRVDIYMRATAWKGEPINKEPDKCDDVRWVSYTELPHNMVPDVHAVLEAAKVGKRYSEANF